METENGTIADAVATIRKRTPIVSDTSRIATTNGTSCETITPKTVEATVLQ